MEELVAVAVERFDGVATEVDGELGSGDAIGRVVFEKLEDAETVNTFGAGVDEEVGGMEVAAEGGPKVGGAELLAEEGGHGGFDVVMEKGGEGVVGVVYGLEGFGEVEGVAKIHFVDSRGNGGAGAEGDARGGAALWPHSDGGMGGEELADGACFGEFLKEIEVFATLEGRNAANASVGPEREGNGTSEGGEGIGIVDEQEVDEIVAHVAFVAKHGAVEGFDARERMVVGDGEGIGRGEGVHGVENGFEVVVVEVGVGVETDDEFVAVMFVADAVE